MSSLSEGSSIILDEQSTSGSFPLKERARSILSHRFPEGRRIDCSFVSKSVFMSIDSAGSSLFGASKNEMWRNIDSKSLLSFTEAMSDSLMSQNAKSHAGFLMIASMYVLL